MSRILIVDDDVELCELLDEYLGQEGFDVSAVHNAGDGVKLSLSEEFTLIVLDVMLPGKSGFEVLREIRQHSRVPVIMLTARGDEVDRIVAAEKAAILTDKVNTPGDIAAELMARGREGYKVYLCENLGSPQERIVITDIRSLRGMTTADLNLLILIKEYDGTREACQPVLGIPDEEFRLPRRIMTQEEIRVLTLAKLRLRQDIILWDIGAGSGSVSTQRRDKISSSVEFLQTTAAVAKIGDKYVVICIDCDTPW